MAIYTIRCVGFNSQQQTSFSAVLDLARSALTGTWSFTDHTDCDVIMINWDNEEARKIKQILYNIPDYRIILVVQDTDQEIQNQWFLVKKEFAPPSLREMVNLLNQIDICLQEVAKSTSPQVPEQHTDNANTYTVELNTIPEDTQQPLSKIDTEQLKDKKLRMPTRKLIPKNYFFGVLLQAAKKNNYRIITLNKLPEIYLSPELNSYYFAGTESELLRYCITAPRFFNVITVSSNKFEKALKNNETDVLFLKDLDALTGYAIVSVSQGRLLEGHSADHQVILEKIPDINKIPVLGRYKVIAEWMYERQASLYEVAEYLQVSLSDVFDFYNACFLLGYTKNVSGISKQPDNLDNKSISSSSLSHFLKHFFKNNSS